MDLDYKLFYRSEKWIALRDRAVKVYGRSCMKCGSKKNIHVDHIFPRSKFIHLELDFSNLQILCRACNEEKSNTDYTDYRSTDEYNIGKRIEGKLSEKPVKKQRPPKKERLEKNLGLEISSNLDKLTDLGRGRYRFKDVFDVCTASNKIFFLDRKTKPMKYRYGIVKILINKHRLENTA